MYIATQLQGKLPVRIKAVAEGTIVPTHNVLMTIESTDETVAWVVNWLETALVRTWYPISVATLSRECAKAIMPYEKVSVDDEKIENDMMFKLNDFGSRGATCQEAAGIGGMAHLTGMFRGTDTVAGLMYAREYYGIDMAGYSLPASEHSTVTAWGRNGEAQMMKNMMEAFKDYPLVACVSDSYDYFNSVDNIWGVELRDGILGTDKIRICRPDSGDPVKCVIYALKSFEKTYGVTINSKGYKVLNNMRVIQGDGINIEDIKNILDAVLEEGFSAENVNFGMGGGLIQKYVNRDTHKFAFKCSYVEVDGEGRDVFKDPITDKGKSSKKGRLALIKDVNGDFGTVAQDTVSEGEDLLKTVYLNGEMILETTMDEIRSRSVEGII
jgi:nicotinamide phosphoribosyltransferase